MTRNIKQHKIALSILLPQGSEKICALYASGLHVQEIPEVLLMFEASAQWSLILNTLQLARLYFSPDENTWDREKRAQTVMQMLAR